MGRKTGRPRGRLSRVQDDTAHLLLCDRVGQGEQRPGGTPHFPGQTAAKKWANNTRRGTVLEKTQCCALQTQAAPCAPSFSTSCRSGPRFLLASLENDRFPHSEVQGQGVGVRRLCGEAVRLRWLPNKSETSRSTGRLTIEGQPKLSSSALFLLPPHAPRPPQQHACDRLMHESTPANGPQVHLWGMSGCPQRKGG